MKTQYFVSQTEAYKLATGSTSAGGASEQVEKKLESLGIYPAGRIKGERRGETVYRPFYDPDEIYSKTKSTAEIRAKIAELQLELENSLKPPVKPHQTEPLHPDCAE